MLFSFCFTLDETVRKSYHNRFFLFQNIHILTGNLFECNEKCGPQQYAAGNIFCVPLHLPLTYGILIGSKLHFIWR